MNKKGQLSIIAALLVAVILVASVITTYSIMRNTPIQDQPPIQSAIDETNFAIKQILGFTVGYYGSVLKVTGNSSYAKVLATNYLQTGLINIAKMHPEWATSLEANDPDLYTNWFGNTSHSKGSLAITYNLTGLGISGVNYTTSCKLSVYITNTTNNQACLRVTKDNDEPVINLGKENFKFFRYRNANSTWELTIPSTEPTAYANGTYQIGTPPGIDLYSYLIQVVDQRGIIVVASSYTYYTCNLTWPSIPSTTATHYYVNNDTSDVDSSPDKGAHDNFTTQQHVDGIFDSLTESTDSSGANASYPSGYNLLGSTQLVSGTPPNLQADDGVYMTFQSYQTASPSQTLYAHSETTNIGGTSYYLHKLTSADAAGTTLSAPMSAVGRQVWGKFVYPLTSVTSVPASTWTTTYRAWRDSTQAITSDAASSVETNAAAGSVSWSHTTGTGYNRLLLVAVGVHVATGTPTTVTGVTYNGVPLAQVTADLYSTASPRVRTYIFRLTNPASGPNTITINFAAPTLYVCGAVTYSGVDQTTPIQTSNTATGSGTSQSVSVTVSGTGRAVFGHVSGHRTTSPTSWTITEGTGQNNRWSRTTYLYKGRGSDKLGVSAGPTSMSWTSSRTTNWVCSAVVINPAPATVAGHCNIDILIRKSDNTVRTTIATGVANSVDLTTTVATITGTYSWPEYTVVDQTDYLEIDYYVDVTTAASGMNAYLRIDDSTLGTIDQTKNANIMPPTEHAVEVEFLGTSNTLQWSQLVWTIDSSFTATGVTATFQLYNYTASAYSTSGDGYMTDTIGTANVTETQTITINPTQFRDSSGNWKLKVKGAKATTTQFDWNVDFVKYEVWPAVNYELDLEEQWTNVNFTSPEAKYICIKTGTLSTETIKVDAWNGSAWIDILGSLTADSWNNASVSAYVQSSNFTIRFKGSNEISDPVQDNWQIDAAFLRFGDVLSLSNARDTVTIELLQNGSMRWLGQDLQLATQAKPVPPLPTKSIRINQTMNGVNCEVPFQIEDWASDYRIPLGLTSNSSVFSDKTMLVFLTNSNVSDVTIWWNGSDLTTQTPYAYTNRYFTGDNTPAGKLTNGMLTLQFSGGTDLTLNSSIGSSSCKATFMRINNQASYYGSGSVAYAITGGIVRDVVHQESEYQGGGVSNCPNFYAHMVLTLPANATYYTYQLRLMFIDSKQNRSMGDLCPIKLEASITQVQTENGTTNGFPTISSATDLFYNSSTSWAHHWSQFISGTKGAGIFLTDEANQELYVFDNLAGAKTGCLRVNSTLGRIELLPVAMAPVSFTNALDVTWYGAVATFDGTTPVYQDTNGQIGGSWINAEYPPTVTVTES